MKCSLYLLLAISIVLPFACAYLVEVKQEISSSLRQSEQAEPCSLLVHHGVL